jgi:phosphoglycolate phosphatase-like HAD superfamily hydrolase
LITDIIWDFDGTLFDTYPATVCAMRKALQDCGIEESDKNILCFLSVSDQYAATHFKELYKLDDRFNASYSSYKRAIKLDEVQPFPLAVEVCRKLVDLGRRNYIVTHRGISTVKILQYYGMTSFFTEVITKENGFKRKPDPEAINYLIQKYQINMRSALIVGDRDYEILSGRAAGIMTCLFNTNDVSTTEAPDFYLNSLSDLEIMCIHANVSHPVTSLVIG